MADGNSGGQPSPLRVMHITSELGLTGASTYIRLVANRLAELGYESLLVTGAGDFDEDELQQYLKDGPCRPVILPELKSQLSIKHDLRTIRRIKALIKEFKPDIVHTHKLKAGFVGRIAARHGVPVVVHTYHGHPFDREYRPWQYGLMHWIERIGARFSHKVITFTGELRDDLVYKYRIASKKRVIVLPLGFDLAKLASQPRHQYRFREQHHIAPDAPLVGMVGKLTSIKNHALFLEAAAQIARKHPTARFVIVGDGDLRASLEQQTASLGLQDVVHFTGWVEDLSSLYSDLDVVVVSSKSEGVPTSIIEGLAAGCRIVSTDVGAARHLLKDGELGLLVEGGDVAGLTDAIVQQVEAVEQAPAQSIRDWMATEYGVERAVRELDSLYRGLLHRTTGERHPARETITTEMTAVRAKAGD